MESFGGDDQGRRRPRGLAEGGEFEDCVWNLEDGVVALEDADVGDAKVFRHRHDGRRGPGTEDTRKGNRPSFADAARPELAEPLYERFCAALRELGVPVETGTFGARMEVELVNDGPVTIVV